MAWRGLEEWRAEACTVELDDGLRAWGVQLAATYRLDYELAAGPDMATERLELTAHDRRGRRTLTLARGSDGAWTANEDPQDHVRGALDCDLAFSPLTNFMPARRLHDDPADLVMAWVSVPDLAVLRSEQRYEPVDGAHVRYVGLDHDFTAVLELDEDGFVVRYPGLAARVPSYPRPR
jgi:hypothetical protein